MEKLLDLLQEFYGENRKFSNENGLLTMTNGVDNLCGAYAQTYIISLQGGFIKWLVDNDKIDISKIKCGYIYNDTDEDKVKNVLMNLAVSDEPISDLVSILK